MSNPSSPANHSTPSAPDTAPVAYEPDAVEAIAFAAPMILPIVGAVLMFLLAFIAVFMA